MKIALIADPAQQSDLEKWQQQLGAILNPDLSSFQADLVIHWTDAVPLVVDSSGRKLQIDFDGDHMTYDRKQLRGKNEPLAKALGMHRGTRRVLDLSVGLASDSVLLSQLGCEVSGVERSPILHFLLAQAFSSTERAELKNYQLHFSNALDFLQNNKESLQFDAIYFDPMYPHPAGKKKSALPKQEMVIFRDLVGDDADADQVLHAALHCGVPKVVVKRPIGGEVLGEKLGYKPSHSSETKVVRFDVYVGRN